MIARQRIRVVSRCFSSASQVELASRIAEQAQLIGETAGTAYDPSLFVEAFQRLATGTHDSFHLSWSMSLLTLAAGFRAVTFPLYTGSLLVGKRRALAAKELTDLRDIAKEAVLLKDQQLVHDIDREYKRKMKSYGLTGNPLQGFGYTFMAQLPWTTTMLFAIRGMSTQPDLFPSFAFDSAFLWCESLALPDPYGILPFISSASIALSSYNRQSDSSQKGSLSARDRIYVNYAVRAACFTFLPFAMQLPAGMLIFFIFNTVFNRIAAPLVHRYMGKGIRGS